LFLGHHGVPDSKRKPMTGEKTWEICGFGTDRAPCISRCGSKGRPALSSFVQPFNLKKLFKHGVVFAYGHRRTGKHRFEPIPMISGDFRRFLKKYL
jgi:hypothetical protein